MTLRAVGFRLLDRVERTFSAPLSPIPLWKWGSEERLVRWRVRGRPVCAERCLQRLMPTNSPSALHAETCGRLHDLGKRRGPEPRQDLPPEQLRVVGRTRIGLVPLRERPLAGRDGGTTPVPDLGALARVGRFVGLVQPDSRGLIHTEPSPAEGDCESFGLLYVSHS
jgi:hypothetical protein